MYIRTYINPPKLTHMYTCIYTYIPIHTYDIYTYLYKHTNKQTRIHTYLCARKVLSRFL